MQIFHETGALLEGHFLLSSGRHSDRYFQCARVLQYPDHAERLCRELVSKINLPELQVVTAPALGGIIAGYEVARALGVRSIFAERENGRMTLRRGFGIAPGERVLVVEDVVTTGGSVREVMQVVREAGGQVVGVGTLVDRSGGRVDFGVPLWSLVQMEVQTFAPDECPLCRQGLPLVKPGSRQQPGA
ncbi:orotate phosphoribosyltransferase [Desulfurispora thermophila]|uniref:orotate phosphoribosyltransferase n=1 Tax=Desulfurispora thermophila TaxID=265470 RepID=UPI0005260346